MEKQKSNLLASILFVLAFGIAFLLHLWVNQNGIGIGPDTISYFGTANKFLEGTGHLIRNTHFPPFYPILLALSSLFNRDVIESARWLHALLFGLNAVLLGASIHLGTRRNLAATALGVLIFLSSKSILTIHSYAWSESPFITLSLLAYLLLSFFISSYRWVYLIFSSICMGLAMTTRYAGVSLLPAAVLVLWILLQRPVKYKIKAILISTAVTAVPILFWVMRNMIFMGSAVNRTFVYHPISISSMVGSITNVLDAFILPTFNAKYFLAAEILLISLAVLYMLITLYRKQQHFSSSDRFGMSTILIGLLFSIAYICMLGITINFLDASTPINERLLLPVFVFAVISVISLVFQYAKEIKKHTVWLVFIACAILSVRAGFPLTYDTAIDVHKNGLGYNSRIWNESPTLAALKTLKPDELIYSNGFDVISLKTEWPAISIPKYFAATTKIENEMFNQQMVEMCSKITKGEAILVYLDNIGRRYLPEEEKILETCSMTVLFDTEDGRIYGSAAK